MAQPQLGSIEVVDIRGLWEHEERDFTPWLAQHIDQLSAALGLQIVIDTTEQKVGGYELDIKGHVEENDAVVIIENQLQCTDHGHLGQLITYAAGLDAAIVIWVAPEVRDEHRSAIEWLNTHMVDSISFFLVRPEVFRIDSSKPAVRFQVEASPDEWGRRLKSLVENEDAPRHEFRRKFWEDLLKFLASNGHPWAAGRSTTKYNWINSSVGKGGVGVQISMAQHSKMRVEIYCANDADKLQFDLLFGQKEAIEVRFPGEAISWERLDGYASSRIALYRPYEKEKAAEDTSHRKELFEWISSRVTIFRAIAKQFLIDN